MNGGEYEPYSVRSEGECIPGVPGYNKEYSWVIKLFEKHINRFLVIVEIVNWIHIQNLTRKKIWEEKSAKWNFTGSRFLGVPLDFVEI